MSRVLVTGSGGLIGMESVIFFANHFDEVYGIDNDFRKTLFGIDGSNSSNINNLKNIKNYKHFDIDITDYNSLKAVFENSFDLIIHTAAQPSHDLAADNPMLDFSINANGTLHILELARKFSPNATLIYTSTNKVYGDNPNKLQFIEMDTRYECKSSISESMNIDNNLHSLFGVSKLSGDLLFQEYGKYFGMKTCILRCGCLTGENHTHG